MHLNSGVQWIVLGSFILVSASCDKPVKKQYVIASVGNETLSLQEIMENIPQEIKQDLSPSDIQEYVQRWINSQVLYQEAKHRKLDERMDLRKEFEKVKRELMVNKLIELSVKDDEVVGPEEIGTFYEQNKDSYILHEDLVHAYHILVPTYAEANKVRMRLRKGEAFQKVCEEVLGDSTEQQDWDLGYFSKDEIIPEVARVLFRMAPGALSLPIKSEFGYHIVKLIDIQKKGAVNPLENVQEEIKLKLGAQKRRQRYERFLFQMKSKTKIQTNFHVLDTVNLDSLTLNGN